MLGTINIPKYTSKDFSILVASMLPMAILLNYFLYGNYYFNHVSVFLLATLVSFGYLALAFITYGLVAISLRNRFPNDNELFQRMAICISIFFLMSAVYISILLLAYDYFHFLDYEYSDNDFTTAYFSFITVNVFLTFLNEGVYRFEKYKATITETEQLNKEYIQSQLLGLKSQMNPHFLFNSLNTLSSLINEDPERAEDFLDHMSKVYRYLLRNNEEKLVTLETELHFIQSYYYLLRSRYKEGLSVDIQVPEEQRQCLIPPLTLQMIIECTMNQNAVTKNHPLLISIVAFEEWLEIRHGLQPKFNSTDDRGEAIENIANKFRLLCQRELSIRESDKERTIRLPLLPNAEMVTA